MTPPMSKAPSNEVVDDKPQYLAFKPSIWNRLGFHSCAAYLDDKDYPDMANAYIDTDVYAHLSWMDRIRILISGKVMVSLATKTNVIVERALSASKISVLPPNYPLRKP